VLTDGIDVAPILLGLWMLPKGPHTLQKLEAVSERPHRSSHRRNVTPHSRSCWSNGQPHRSSRGRDGECIQGLGRKEGQIGRKKHPGRNGQSHGQCTLA